MRKSSVVCSVLGGVVSLLSLPAIALAEGVVVSVEAPSEVESGTGFDAKVSVSDVVDFDSANFDLRYDPDVLEVVDVMGGQIGGTDIPLQWLVGPGGVPGDVRVIGNIPGAGPEGGASGAGCLAQIRFRVIGSPGTTSRLVLSGGAMNDNFAGPIDARWGSSSVKVVDGAAAPTDGSDPVETPAEEASGDETTPQNDEEVPEQSPEQSGPAASAASPGYLVAIGVAAAVLVTLAIVTVLRRRGG